MIEITKKEKIIKYIKVIIERGLKIISKSLKVIKENSKITNIIKA